MIVVTGGLIETERGRVYWDKYTDDGEYVEIYNLSVKPQFRKRGYARTLMIGAISLIRLQYPDLEIRVIPEPSEPSVDKDRLIKFYRSFGLRIHYLQTERKTDETFLHIMD